MAELHLFGNNVKDFFVGLDNSFQILQKYFLIFCTIHNVTLRDTTLLILMFKNLHS